MLGLAVIPFAVGAGDAVVTPIMTKELEDIPGKEARMLVVEYPSAGAVGCTAG